jgi:uroporphyrinogen decarboxylase
MASMTHRQRVWAALNHQEPDRVPLDLGTGTSSTTVPEAHDRLLRYFHIDHPTRIMPAGFRLSFVDEAIMRALDIDTRPVMMRAPSRPTRLCAEPHAFYDDFGVLWREVEHGGGSYNEMVEHPLAEATLEDLESYPYWPDPDDPARYAGLADEARDLFCSTDYAIIAMPAFNSVWERTWFLRGLEQTMQDMVLNPEFIHALLRKITDINKRCMQHYLDAVGPYAQIIRLGDDVATQNGPLISPAMYRSIIKPYQKEFMTFIHERTEAKIWYHSCGSVYKLIPDLIDAGIDLLNPVQVSARDMDTRRLKAEFGDSLTFCGGIDTQHVLPLGTIEEVQREVERRIGDLAPGGGYILAAVHNIQDDVPPENVVAMFQHARKAGTYPINLNIPE